MNVRNCRKCGRIFNYVVGPILCPACRESQEATFQNVKKYVEDHRGAGIAEVAQECDVDPSQIRQWIREDRLQFADDSPIRIACEKCGAMIRSGRFCDKCKAEMTNNLNSAYKKPQAPGAGAGDNQKNQKETDKMRFL